MGIEKISVIGLGRVGLPTALLFADSGFDVVGVDRDSARCELLNRGDLPILEPGLGDVLSRVLETEKFAAQTELPQDVDAFVVCVGTTVDGRFDAAPVARVVEQLDRDVVVIVESTLPVGGSERFADRRFAYCPERLAPGTLFPTVFEQPRLVSAFSEPVRTLVTSLYERAGFQSLEQVTPPEAELCKLAENAFRDANIAFANQLAMRCAEHGVDARRVIAAANSHPRVTIHNPGIGVGGACLAPASRTLSEGRDLFETVRNVNEAQVQRIVFQLSEVSRIGLFGVAYKPGSDDCRHAPAQRLITRLKSAQKSVAVWDPVARVGELESIRADAIVIGCGHPEFAQLDAQEVAATTGATLLIDYTGVTDFERWRSAGFSCISR